MTTYRHPQAATRRASRSASRIEAGTRRREAEPVRTGEDVVGVPGSVLSWVLRRFWWLILLSAALSSLLALNTLASSPDSYSSQARVMVGPLNGSTDSLRAAGSIGQTYADAMSTPVALRAAAQDAGLRGTDAELASAVTVSANDKSRIITVQAVWDDPREAQRLTAAMLDRLLALQKRSPRENPVPGAEADVLAQRELRRVAGLLTVIQTPSLPDDAQPGSHIAVAGLAGVAGAVLAFTAVTLAGGARARRSAGVRHQLPTGVLLGDVHATRRRKVVTGPAAARYAEVARHLQLRAPEGGWHRLVVTADADLGEAADHAALNLAAALARTGMAVDLVDREELLPADGPAGLTVTRTEPSTWFGPARADEPTAPLQEAGQGAAPVRLPGERRSAGATRADHVVLRFVRAGRPQDVTAGLSHADGVVLLSSVRGSDPVADAATLSAAAQERGAVLAGVVLVSGTLVDRLLVPDLRLLS